MASAHEFPTENTIYLMLPMGSKVCIGLIDNDGEVTVSFTDREFKIEVDMPDSSGRVGEVYNERFADDFEKLDEMAANNFEGVQPGEFDGPFTDELLDGGIDGPYNETAKSMTLLEHDRDEMGIFEDFEGMDSGIDTQPHPKYTSEHPDNDDK